FILMPRKVTKTAKPSLQFLERPLCGAKLQNVPEIRAALNARDFFTEAEAQSSSALNSWVRPQFDISVATAPPVRRGRRKCQSATSILDSCSQLSRKNSGQFASVRKKTVCASTLPCEEFSTTEVSSVCPPPDVDTPKAMEERNISPSTPCGHLLLAQPCTPPCNESPDILVADTPERDYGMKVTWRRRKNLMVLLKQRGHLSEADKWIKGFSQMPCN
uniref:RAD9-HUS1-RAD1 interacting nuclear orphan 1 n=1 Tax=Pundamilia nyererei TaxID=303518 RepID=A0A3B4GLG6_9CICH